MKKIGILIFAIAFIAMSFTLVEENYTVDTASSKITWKGYKPTGDHSGTIMLKSGTIKMSAGKLKSGLFVADMSSIKDNDGSAKLEGHLKSADFFDVEAFETSKFEVTKTHHKAGKMHITGNLTIKGITKEITFEAAVVAKGNTVTLTSETFQVNRADYNVKYKSKSFFDDLKDKFINDEFDLQVTIVAKK
ncbi:YceI family protein [Lutibacter sp. HS1-25]|uniref:YceI family protein n=1 Tax=Lutibacter sp. HS1-25 TaxID=2485000 RepID=UPI0010122594|nr:YceI family protein [Lutibacter sp. HS1-25]RXP57901.1 YceI family protein [Lutibacter sp. HS1-25]